MKIFLIPQTPLWLQGFHKQFPRWCCREECNINRCEVMPGDSLKNGCSYAKECGLHWSSARHPLRTTECICLFVLPNSVCHWIKRTPFHPQPNLCSIWWLTLLQWLQSPVPRQKRPCEISQHRLEDKKRVTSTLGRENYSVQTQYTNRLVLLHIFSQSFACFDHLRLNPKLNLPGVELCHIAEVFRSSLPRYLSSRSVDTFTCKI